MSVPRRARRVLERERERAAFLAGILDAVPVAGEEAVEPLGAGALPRLGLHLAVDQRRVRGEIPDRLVPLAVEAGAAGVSCDRRPEVDDVSNDLVRQRRLRTADLGTVARSRRTAGGCM